MNNLVNSNKWKSDSKDLKVFAEDLTSGVAVKVQHSFNDWEVVGTSTKGHINNSNVYYESDITDPKAVEKFETGTWNERNMGTSPSISFEKIKCSCGEIFANVYEHNHKPGDKNGKEIYYYIPMGGHLKEMSLTSNPAYKESGAGNIESVAFAAELDEMFNKNKQKDGGSIMEEETFKAVIAEKDNRINELSASVTEKTEKVKELEASISEKDTKLSERDTKIVSMEAEFKSTKESLGKYIKATREIELKKRVDNQDVINDILGREMTDEEFKSELKKIDVIQSNVRSNVGKGSLAEESSENLAQRETKIGAEMFGSNYKKLAGMEV
jgi:hypothetical protein